MSKKGYYNSRMSKRSGGCLPIIFIILALALSSCTLEIVDKEKEAKLVAAQVKAEIQRAAAAQELEQDAALHALEIAELNEAIAERNAARKIWIWAVEIAKVLSLCAVLGLIAGGAFALILRALSYIISVFQRDKIWAGMVYPDARGFLPLQVIHKDGEFIYAINHATNSVIKLDAPAPADRQLTKGWLELQQANRLAKGAGNPFNKNAAQFAAIMPESTPPSAEILSTDIKQLVIDSEAIEK